LAIKERFNISPLLFAVPVVVVVLIARKTPPLVALLIGTLLGAIFALLFQQPLLAELAGVATLDMDAGYKGNYGHHYDFNSHRNE
jgi:NhaC family Na+:H+ antiporter